MPCPSDESGEYAYGIWTNSAERTVRDGQYHSERSGGLGSMAVGAPGPGVATLLLPATSIGEPRAARA
eukprot:523655-Prymnesium_polylepis.1